MSDTAGNSVTEDISITISKVDDQDPSISSFTANDTTVELTTSSQSQAVTFTVAYDNVVAEVKVPGTTSGSAFGGSYTFSKTYNYSNFSFGNSSDTLTATVTDTLEIV